MNDTSMKSPSLFSPSPLPSAEEFEALCCLPEIDTWQAQDVLESYTQNPPASIPRSQFDHDFAADMDDSEALTDADRRQHDGEDEKFGRWPHRLLHVPSMTSMEWQPGNVYGTYIAPKYSAVSYTWGRYDLDRPGVKCKRKYRNIRGIDIKGIDWPVPRINPDEQFSVDQFQTLIQQTCEPIKNTDERTDFLWLDVACIDQNNGPQKMAEIGRQAVIFQGAQRVFIWLTKIHKERLSRILNELVQSSGEPEESHSLL